jgi:hypothetical protein
MRVPAVPWRHRYVNLLCPVPNRWFAGAPALEAINETINRGAPVVNPAERVHSLLQIHDHNRKFETNDQTTGCAILV